MLNYYEKERRGRGKRDERMSGYNVASCPGALECASYCINVLETHAHGPLFAYTPIFFAKEASRESLPARPLSSCAHGFSIAVCAFLFASSALSFASSALAFRSCACSAAARGSRLCQLCAHGFSIAVCAFYSTSSALFFSSSALLFSIFACPATARGSRPCSTQCRLCQLCAHGPPLSAPTSSFATSPLFLFVIPAVMCDSPTCSCSP